MRINIGLISSKLDFTGESLFGKLATAVGSDRIHYACAIFSTGPDFFPKYTFRAKTIIMMLGKS